MASLATLAVELNANSENMIREFRKAGNHVKSLEQTFVRSGDNIKKAVAGYFSFAAAREITTNVLSVSMEFENLRASLETVFGSQQAAALQFQRINAFASKTPFTIQEITEAAIMMRSLGLDPTTKALESMGNTASALGKPLMQFTEAVADAVTGEFERLKEFGIKSQKEGEKVTFTFRGMETEVANSADAINGYLLRIGETEFAGAVAKQSETLSGVLSTLGGAVDGLAVKFAEKSGLAKAVKEAAKSMTELVNSLATGRASIKAMEEELERLENRGGRSIRKGRGLSESVVADRIRNLRLEITLAKAESGSIKDIDESIRLLNEDLTRAEEAIAAQPERRRRRRGGGPAPSEAETEKADLMAQIAELEALRATVEEDAAAREEREGATPDSAAETGTSITPPAEVTESELERLEESLMTKSELLNKHHIEEIDALTRAREQGLITEKKYQDLAIRAASKHAKSMEKLRSSANKKEIMSSEMQARTLLSGLSQYSTAAASINKAFAVKDAILNAKAGITKTLAAYPYPINVAFAAAHAALAFAQVRDIVSGGSSSGGIGGASVPTVTDTDVEAVAEVAPEEERTKTIVLNVQGISDEALLTKGQVRDIVDQINEERESNVRIIL